MGKDFGGDGAPSVIGDEEKRLQDALGETMKERKKKEGQGDIVECNPQVLQAIYE